MQDARKCLKPRYSFARTSKCIAILVDNILFRIFPDQVKFQLDRLGDEPDDKVRKEFEDI